MKLLFSILYIYSISLLFASTVYIFFLSEFILLNDLNFIAITSVTVLLLVTPKKNKKWKLWQTM
jgi:hypothetical protein